MKLLKNEIQEQTTYTGDVILGMDEDLTKDNPIKRLIACRPILAFILLHTMSEFEGATQEEVEQSIVGSVKVSSVAVDPGLTNTVQLEQQEDHVKGEGAVYYDVRATVVIPGESEKREAKILINLEGQRDDRPGYDLSLRALFYCCRMISAQLGTEFTNKKDDPVKYNGIRKVYSIFICPVSARKRAGSIEEYKVQRDVIAGWNDDQPRYDIMRAFIVYVNANGKAEDDDDELIKMLTDLFSNSISSKEKVKRLQDNYGIKTTRDIVQEVAGMDAWARMYMEGAREEAEKKAEKKIEEAREEAREEAGEKAIRNMIGALRDFSIKDNEIVVQLGKRYGLTEEQAKEYLTQSVSV